MYLPLGTLRRHTLLCPGAIFLLQNGYRVDVQLHAIEPGVGQQAQSAARPRRELQRRHPQGGGGRGRRGKRVRRGAASQAQKNPVRAEPERGKTARSDRGAMKARQATLRKNRSQTPAPGLGPPPAQQKPRLARG
jgi:hypothetical protein